MEQISYLVGDGEAIMGVCPTLKISHLQASDALKHQQWFIGAEAPNELCRGNSKTGKTSHSCYQPLPIASNTLSTLKLETLVPTS